MQIDDEHDEAICTSPMILETVDDKVYEPRTSAHETLETVGQVEDDVGKFIKIPFFNWYNSQLDFSQLEDFLTRFLAPLARGQQGLCHGPVSVVRACVRACVR
ncbi:hypothetical protein DPMN_193365 [Dreissena polymorpha]|uniref:Uncharacterized protein n=1 Tax=Dreissena polymorpha TaxID=45954 RepID=A0A9D4BFN5_DREPO|nr:hypothetical protein DPMN_193365 [Dreissena polymorpha]